MEGRLPLSSVGVLQDVRLRVRDRSAGQIGALVTSGGHRGLELRRANDRTIRVVVELPQPAMVVVRVETGFVGIRNVEHDGSITVSPRPPAASRA